MNLEGMMHNSVCLHSKTKILTILIFDLNIADIQPEIPNSEFILQILPGGQL